MKINITAKKIIKFKLINSRDIYHYSKNIIDL